MSGANPMKWVGVLLIWSGIAGVAYFGYQHFVAPAKQEANARQAALAEWEQTQRIASQRKFQVPELPEDATVEQIQEQTKLLKQRLTGSEDIDLPIDTRVRLALDSFSGYAIFRSPEFRQNLAASRIGIELVDDGADYAQRLRTLQSGETPLAVFTIDALLKTSAELGSTPATIVMVLDETVGADAIVAYQESVPNIDTLNNPQARMVAIPDSPSETLGRVVMAHFNLPDLPEEPWQPANQQQEILQQLENDDRSEPRAYILWEPHVSQALSLPGTHRLIDSSRFTGYIVDVLVVQRDYLLKNEATVRAVAEAYLSTLYQINMRPQGWQTLVAEDAEQQGTPLKSKAVQSIVDGIWWKNTRENYAHFFLLSSQASRGLQPLSSIIANIQRVLVKTKAIAPDAVQDADAFYYRDIMQHLYDHNFHPHGSGKRETIRGVQTLPSLSDQQWKQLVPVGTLSVERIVFRPGSPRLIGSSKFALTRLAETLQTWPQYYLVVQGNISSQGDPQANRQLAQQRAEAVVAFLKEKEIPPHRVRAETVPASDNSVPSVSFVLGQTPY